jgi:hypothetical protein
MAGRSRSEGRGPGERGIKVPIASSFGSMVSFLPSDLQILRLHSIVGSFAVRSSPFSRFSRKWLGCSEWRNLLLLSVESSFAIQSGLFSNFVTQRVASLLRRGAFSSFFWWRVALLFGAVYFLASLWCLRRVIVDDRHHE